MGKYVEQGRAAPHRIDEDDPLAIRVLKEEHQAFRVLFDKAEEAEGEALAGVAQELCMRLGVHMTLEEEIFYPAVKGVVDVEEVKEGVVEHATGKAIVAELEQLNGTEELFGTKIHVLGEVTMHHVDEEDEEMFAEARKAHQAGRIDLEEVGERLEARRRELYDRIAATGEEGATRDADANEVASV